MRGNPNKDTIPAADMNTKPRSWSLTVAGRVWLVDEGEDPVGALTTRPIFEQHGSSGSGLPSEVSNNSLGESGVCVTSDDLLVSGQGRDYGEMRFYGCLLACFEGNRYALYIVSLVRSYPMIGYGCML